MSIRNFHSNIAIKTVYSSVSVEMADLCPLYFTSKWFRCYLRLDRKNKIEKKKKRKEKQTLKLLKERGFFSGKPFKLSVILLPESLNYLLMRKWRQASSTHNQNKQT